MMRYHIRMQSKGVWWYLKVFSGSDSTAWWTEDSDTDKLIGFDRDHAFEVSERLKWKSEVITQSGNPATKDSELSNHKSLPELTFPDHPVNPGRKWDEEYEMWV